MLTLSNHPGRLSFAVVFAAGLTLAALADPAVRATRSFNPEPAATANSLTPAAGPAVRITKVEPTGSFENGKPGEPRRQVVRLTVENPGAALEASARVRLWGAADHEEPIGRLAAGTGTVSIHVPELPDRSELTIVLYQNGESKPIAIEETPWPPQPPPQSNVSCVAYARRAAGHRPHRLWARLRNN